MVSEYELALSALYYCDPSCSYEEWFRIAMAVKAAGLPFEIFHEWSRHGKNYKGEKDCKTAWESFKPGKITAATLFYIACEKGWYDFTKNQADTSAINNKNNRGEEKEIYQDSNSIASNKYALTVWERCVPALPTHEYIVRKRGITNGLRVYPSTAQPLIIHEKNVAGYLVIPCLSNGKLQTLQFIPPDEGNEKLNLGGASFNDGYFHVGTITDVIYLCEGIGQAWANNKSSGSMAVVCFGANRMMAVAKILRAQYPSAHLIIAPDRGKEKQAAEIATAIAGVWVKIPSQFPINYDTNDYLREHGEDALRTLLAKPELPLNVIFADELSTDFTPIDELLEGVFTIGDGSVIYGDSNSGKTFLVIDLACAIARGVEWFGRKTERGLVIYLAAESPASVQRRLQAYQQYHNVRVTNFAIVQSPIDLFDGEADTDAIIQTVRLLERQYGQKARLIVGDTLARLSAGANENAGQDMGLVVRHFDRIRNECNVHFSLIHHIGKNAAAGARGWSGVRAAIDTEIEITDSPTGRCAEITKQRDLGTKGIRIGFKLETVTLGLTKWKSPATSCIVMPADAPSKQVSKRSSQIAGAIIEYLTSSKIGVKKSEVVNHLADRYSESAIYREIKKLVKNKQISGSFGYVRVLVPTSAN